MGNPLSDQEYDWYVTRLAEEKLLPMTVSIERKPCPCQPVVTHCPYHFQSAQIVEAIAGIIECCAAWLHILS